MTARDEFSQLVKDKARQRSGGRCECNGECEQSHLSQKCLIQCPLLTPQYHHIQPAAQGGPGTLSNCRVLCIGCHDRITKKQASR